MSLLECEKIELALSTNSFGAPCELTKATAWAKLVTNLLFMKKGTYPTDPEMGCELQKYDFNLIDDGILDSMEMTISDQISKYLPDIPFVGATITQSELSNGATALVIVLQFDVPEDDENSIVVAAENSNNKLNFTAII